MKTLKNIERALESLKTVIEIQQRSVVREDGVHPSEIKMTLEDSSTMFYNLMSVRDQLEAAEHNLNHL